MATSASPPHTDTPESRYPPDQSNKASFLPDDNRASEEDPTSIMAVAPRRFDDYSMEVPLEADQCPSTAANYRFAATVGLISDFMVAVPLLVDSGAVMNLVNLNFLPKKWHSAIQPYQGNQLNSANQSTLEVVGVIKLCLCLGDLNTA